MFALVGGAEASITTTFACFDGLSTTEDPVRVSIPLASDKDRNGFCYGWSSHGSRNLEHAEKREQTILAEIVGYGNTCDA